MSSASHHHDPFSSSSLAVPGIRAGLVGVAITVFHAAKAVWRNHRNRQVTRELLTYDDALLRDIGLTRGDVAAALQSGHDDPTRDLSRISNMRRRFWHSAS